MIHGYHIILPVYGFWLPNDPRGSWSDVVWRWELVRFARATRSLERRPLEQLTPAGLKAVVFVQGAQTGKQRVDHP